MLKPLKLNHLIVILACSLINSVATSNDCDAGFLFSNGSCVSCPEHCTGCSSAIFCWWCKDYYWNVTARCEMPCPPNCPSPCDVTTGKCISCNPGFYGDDCAHSCDSCRYDICSNKQCRDGCKDGYYQDTFQGSTYPICRECSVYCLRCDNFYKCNLCQPGFFLFDYNSSAFVRSLCLPCSHDCSSCINVDRCTFCQHLDKHCIECKYDGISYSCTQCESGFSLLNNQCYVENTCSLNCLNGCGTGGKCIQCKTGFSGYYCNEKCNEVCDTCTQQNPNICDHCKHDFYTIFCNKTCNGNCFETDGNSACDIETGICSNGCKPGYWGKYCGSSCSMNCLESENKQNECSRFNGTCLFGCKPDFTGLMCDLRITTTAVISLKTTFTVDSLKSTTVVDSLKSTEEEQLGDSAKKNVVVGAVVGTLAGFIMIGAGSVAIFFIMKKRQRKSQSTRKPVYVNTIIDPVQSKNNPDIAPENTEGLTESSVYQQLSNHTTGNEYSVLSTQRLEPENVHSKGSASHLGYYNLGQ